MSTEQSGGLLGVFVGLALAVVLGSCLSLGEAMAQEGTAIPKVAVLVPLSGPHKSLGRAVKQTLEWVRPALALELEWVWVDSEGDAGVAASKVLELQADTSILAVLGPVGHEESKQLVEAKEKGQLPIFLLSSVEGLENTSMRIFRARLSAEEQSRALAKFALTVLGKTRAGVFHPDDDYGRSCMQAFVEQFELLGGELGAVESYPADEKKPKEQAELLTGKRVREPVLDEQAAPTSKSRSRAHASVDFETLFIPDDGGDVARNSVYLELAGLDSGVQLLGTSAWLVGSLGAAEGRLAGAYVLRLFDAEHESVTALSQAFFDATGRLPTDFEAQSADAALLLAHSMLRCASSPTRDCVAQGLASGARIEGVAGGFSLNAQGAPVREMFVYEVDADGQMWRVE